MMNPRQGPSSLARLATHSLLSTSGDGASLCCSLAGLSCISSSRTESCPSTTHPRTRTGPLPGRSPSQSVVCICGDPSLTANAPQNAVVAPSPDLLPHTLSFSWGVQHTHTHMPSQPARTHSQKSTLLSSSPPVIPPAPLPPWPCEFPRQWVRSCRRVPLPGPPARSLAPPPNVSFCKAERKPHVLTGPGRVPVPEGVDFGGVEHGGAQVLSATV